MVKHINDIPYSPWGFFNLRGQIDTGHGDDLKGKKRENSEVVWSEANTMTPSQDINYNFFFF